MALPSALFCGCSASALREAKEASGHISGPIKEGGILQYARSDVDYAARMRAKKKREKKEKKKS